MNDNLIASTNKLSSLIKMIEWHARVVDMAKHMNMVGGAGPGPLVPTPKFGAAKSYTRGSKTQYYRQDKF